mgnify:CR=1 FL=1
MILTRVPLTKKARNKIMINFSLNSESERVALIESLTYSVERLQGIAIEATQSLTSDAKNGGKEYWIEKLTAISVDLKSTNVLLDRVKSAKKIEDINEEDL